MTTTATSTRFRVRPATEAELDTVGQLTFEGFGHHLPGAPQPTPERRALLLDAAARARDGVILVAENLDTGSLVGTATLLPFGSTLARQALEGETELRLLAVLPEARRSGIGWKLLEEAVALSIESGAHTVVLDTGLENEQSQLLYRRFGFVRRPEREKPRPAPHVQLVIYTLNLPRPHSKPETRTGVS
ncbi:GNAT family N-acetyltransferase [Pseudarthrobacter sp. fls2-241-R2A-168]|uniref:GNAT family N-acetyltransferase n=1 Tax=Pseudarthrobacter sp. fls2-241-R2A-168 TaxID=3040304 RepID=UPI0025537A82|nr:GNAT family N-acetyltransferase [Pseudarthrobacter sp. fls2-241-R2A-168]